MHYSDLVNVSNLCLYGMIGSSILLIAYIAVFFAFKIDLWPRVLQVWGRIQGKTLGEEKHLLHTLPYYLAVTRSSCEVSSPQDATHIR